MAPTVYNIKDAQFRNKMIGLDYDWSLVNPKDGKTFPTHIDDWEWFSSTVPDKLKQYYDDGYRGTRGKCIHCMIDFPLE